MPRKEREVLGHQATAFGEAAIRIAWIRKCDRCWGNEALQSGASDQSVRPWLQTLSAKQKSQATSSPLCTPAPDARTPACWPAGRLG